MSQLRKNKSLSKQVAGFVQGHVREFEDLHRLSPEKAMSDPKDLPKGSLPQRSL
jgi:hypothetical protein